MSNSIDERTSAYSHDPEVATLLNPAFLTLLIRRLVEGHQGEGEERPLPLPLAYVGVTMALYPPARESLTNNVASNFATWAANNPRVRAQLPSRAVAMVPIVAQAVLFGLHHRVIAFQDGGLMVSDKGPTKAIKGGTVEVVACQKAAYYLGRWFARSGSTSTVLALMGVRL